LERTIYLPDSLCAVPGPRNVVYNRANQTVYVGGSGLNVLALDGATGRRQKVMRPAYTPVRYVAIPS